MMPVFAHVLSLFTSLPMYSRLLCMYDLGSLLQYIMNVLMSPHRMKKIGMVYVVRLYIVARFLTLEF